MWGAGDRSAPPLVSQLTPCAPGALEGLATFQPSREEPGEEGRCFQAETLLLWVVPTEQHLWKEWAEQGRGKKSAKKVGAWLFPVQERGATRKPRAHSSERENSPAMAKLWPTCCGSMENGLKIYRQKATG